MVFSESETDQNLARSCWCSTYCESGDIDWIRLGRTVTPAFSAPAACEIRIVDDKVIDVGIGVGTAAGKKVVVDVPDLIDVHAEFDGVLPEE